MLIELQMLVWSVVLGLVVVAIAATLGTQQRGLGWNVGARDGIPAPLTGVAARMDRASRNFLETFPFFAVVVLIAIYTQHTNSSTALGAQLYFWARVAYVPIYAAGIPYLRTLAWTVSIVGLVKILLVLF
ncbi:hypothetical protein ELE36_02310 [Pseudolysobacter antarcticus]|uniref:MAPEG family protein n=1 Tax=Pseudolysobacter antarcticus TaxID=2511995 RepID=A0A411HFQ5_9GAMM|nr:MAPEG family protein [Pseudolysobacter antarcticus]QBB69300.1 hypothetical protein ELE36_02310 [Pseudolysobacter antarcticus]